MVKVYFCGSIRGGRELASTYKEIIKRLQVFTEVLTEHIGIEEILEKESLTLSDRDIYERDLSWLNASDVVVAEVTVPSLGVGYEIGHAIKSGKPVLCLFNLSYENNLSAMVTGCPELTVLYYTKPKDIEDAVRQYIVKHVPGQNL